MDVPRGNTQRNVNRTILERLVPGLRDRPGARVLDVPCGEGEFLEALRRLVPGVEVHGIDVTPPRDPPEGIAFETADATRDFEAPGGPFDVITSISGVMMFGNTKSFVENCARQLKSGGTFVLTNDNSFTIRDRISFLFLGRLRRYRLVFGPDEGITNHVPIQELARLLDANRIRIREVAYTSFYPEDLLWLPLLVPIALIQLAYLRWGRHALPPAERRRLFPLRSLWLRHYVIFGEKL